MSMLCPSCGADHGGHGPSTRLLSAHLRSEAISDLAVHQPRRLAIHLKHIHMFQVVAGQPDQTSHDAVWRPLRQHHVWDSAKYSLLRVDDPWNLMKEADLTSLLHADLEVLWMNGAQSITDAFLVRLRVRHPKCLDTLT